MAKRDECHDLIRTLSAREKAYFQRFAKRHSDRDIPDYLRLFRVLDALPVYDEQALRRRLKGSPLLSRLSSAKRYLYRQLLKALDLYTAGAHWGRQVDNLRREAEILAGRGLFQAAERQLDQAAELAREREDFERLLALSSLRLRVYEMEARAQLTEEVRQINREREGLMDRLRNLDAYRTLRFTLFDLHERVGFVGPEESLPELDTLEGHALLSGPGSALSMRARERYHYVSNLLRFLRKLPFQGERPVIRRHLEDLLRDMETLAEDPQRNLFLEYFPFVPWLRHQLDPGADLAAETGAFYRRYRSGGGRP